MPSRLLRSLIDASDDIHVQVAVNTYTSSINTQGNTLPDLVGVLDLGATWPRYPGVSGGSKVVIMFVKRSEEVVTVAMCRTSSGSECSSNAPSAVGGPA